MAQLYDSYSRSEFTELVSHMNVSDFARPQLTAPAKAEIVPFEMAQIPNVLFATGWTNHRHHLLQGERPPAEAAEKLRQFVAEMPMPLSEEEKLQQAVAEFPSPFGVRRDRGTTPLYSSYNL